ncbi:MAG: hypothetical protein H6748_10295 [Spirochaetaceae bacterium]|nr:hypothetical protein [Myxococcales bacterium]MCB9724421.1 hypothetical protein [Spirochaetaceae bacterium]
MKPSELFDEGDRARIEAAVAEAETGTSGEIVVAVERASGSHAAAPWRFAVGLAAIVLLGVGLARPGTGLLEAFGVQAIAVGVALGLGRIDAVRRVFATEAELERAARQAALRAFTENGIRRTRDRTGILIYVTLLEHRVVVLGDEAIDRALGPEESWEEVVALVLDGIRAGRATEGIVAGVRRCGEILAHPLPPRADDTNEIVHGLVLHD